MYKNSPIKLLAGCILANGSMMMWSTYTSRWWKRLSFEIKIPPIEFLTPTSPLQLFRRVRLRSKDYSGKKISRRITCSSCPLTTKIIGILPSFSTIQLLCMTVSGIRNSTIMTIKYSKTQWNLLKCSTIKMLHCQCERTTLSKITPTIAGFLCWMESETLFGRNSGAIIKAILDTKGSRYPTRSWNKN